MSGRKRIREEEKIPIAIAYINGSIGLTAAAEQVGVHHSVSPIMAYFAPIGIKMKI